MSLESTPNGLDHRFPALDSLRAVAATAVVTTHTAYHLGYYTGHGVWGVLLARLDVGVAVFFVLSGFLLSRPYLARAGTGVAAPSTGRYLWKRFLRIYPVFAAACVVGLLLVPGNAGTTTPGEWLTTLLMANIYLDPSLPTGLAQMWSLATEVAFYLLLPALMLHATQRGRVLQPRRVARLLAVMGAVSVGWYLVGEPVAGAVTGGATERWLPGYLTWFAVGIGLALVQVLHQRPRTPRLVGVLVAAGRRPGLCWLAAGLLMLLVSATPIAGPVAGASPTALESLTKNLAYALVGGLVVLPAVFTGADSPVQQLLRRPLLRHLGVTSFGVFCLHLPLLHLLLAVTGYEQSGGHLLLIWILIMAVSLTAAEAAYRLLERPCARFKDLGVRPVGVDAQPATEREPLLTEAGRR